MPRRSLAETTFATRSLGFRLDLLGRFQERLLSERESLLLLLAELRPHSSRAELISSELIPLLDNATFLRKQAPRILRPQRLGRRGQPVWLFGVKSEVYREALGRVLLLAPGNYPLFLPLVQCLYAWAAGNTVWLKSAPGSLPLHDRLRDLFLAVGGAPEVFRLLGEDTECYAQALAEGVDKVVLIGSAQTGEAVLAQAGRALVPAVAELSGCDAVFIHPQADLARAAAAIAFGLCLNGGRTCVAPRRIFFQGDLERFESLLETALRARLRVPLSAEEKALVARATAQGARALGGPEGPLLLSRIGPEHPLLRKHHFGALAVLCPCTDDAEALRLAQSCPYALGASLFGPPEWAESLAHRVPAQMVNVNDMIVTAADPRLPFGGSGHSGFGRMRGEEGLLEMTATRVVSRREGGSLEHLRPPGPADDAIVERFLLLTQAASWQTRTRALLEVIFLIGRERVRQRRSTASSCSAQT
jgi:acyl-CoA reductase-like NAD-dependent aldehyde dehydrogenase